MSHVSTIDQRTYNHILPHLLKNFIMSHPSMYQLPTRLNDAAIYDWENKLLSSTESEGPSSYELSTALFERDTFLDNRRCVVCGIRDVDCFVDGHISGGEPEKFMWADLKERGWIPIQADRLPHHELRNSLSMCLNHYNNFFERYNFFIRFMPQKFVFVNYSDNPNLRQSHGKAIALDIKERNTPFPSLFLIHEMRVRGFHPFQPIAPGMPKYKDITWQDWIISEGLFDDVTGTFKRHEMTGADWTDSKMSPSSLQIGTTLEFNQIVVEEILKATWQSASWKACVEASEAKDRNESAAISSDLGILWFGFDLMGSPPKLHPPSRRPRNYTRQDDGSRKDLQKVGQMHVNPGNLQKHEVIDREVGENVVQAGSDRNPWPFYIRKVGDSSSNACSSTAPFPSAFNSLESIDIAMSAEPLLEFMIPFEKGQPPPGYGWDNRLLSQLGTRTAFGTGIEDRDIFLGHPRCVVCGAPETNGGLQISHILGRAEKICWSNLIKNGWLPLQAKVVPETDPRNGWMLCDIHHGEFDRYRFFIRFVPEANRFILINFSNDPTLQAFHGKAVGLDIKDRHAPFPSLFLIHEQRVRGFHPFEPRSPTVFTQPGTIPWQDWISVEQVFDNTTDTFKRAEVPALPSIQSGSTGQ
ncbi:hypothetical protein D9756_004541 [Leucocoprinus leucothites]|uniref:HNH nuclease domain-containing protein n=1 Tax=Leucocoprinus leucothites TaxID=201217 RepID=A0A8H5G903_9AGAR|nr:hypothetical protein D9756_004541 [Leucoagaricus leucothites]